jgi:hypothetical protein
VVDPVALEVPMFVCILATYSVGKINLNHICIIL